MNIQSGRLYWAGQRFLRPFESIGMADVALVGGKNASLGEMYRELGQVGVTVPNGFALTTDAYRYVLDRADGWSTLRDVLHGLDASDVADLAQRAARARAIVAQAAFPGELRDEILAAYRWLSGEQRSPPVVAVRSSATAEDLPQASFAGQHESNLNICGEQQLLDACHACFASAFTDRAIRYRIDQGFDHFRVLLSVGVQRMVRSDLAASGVTFTLDTESGFRDVVFITGAFGMGENVVQGLVDPDEFYVFKPTLKTGHRAVLRRVLGAKQVKSVLAAEGGAGGTQSIETSAEERARYCLSDEDVLRLADMALAVEQHFSAKTGAAVPMDLEWAKDGLDGRLYIIQARPETVTVRRSTTKIEEYRLTGHAEVLVRGHAVGERVASGVARVIASPADLGEFRDGEILVAQATAPDWGTVMKRAGAIVTDHGGRTCHAAIVARELGIPAVVGTTNATQRIRNGMPVTVSCAAGATGEVYSGKLPFEIERIALTELPATKTRILVNLGNPDMAFRVSFLPNDGVGLARMEFIVSEAIRAHPMALAHPERIADAGARATIEALAAGYATPADYFVERLSEGIGTIAAAFYPKPVIVRMSDFKTNEYASLLGGRDFEPHEENPMLGFRGAARYAHPAYADGFALECRAVKRVRETMGLANLKLMIPFCRRIDEAERVLNELTRNGFERGQGGLEVYVMCEIPNNVLSIDAFAALFDGFSIGSNDLTQLVLGVDRDSEIVAFDFDERDEGVKAIIRLAIEGAHRNRRHCGICGQAPSDYPEFAEFLVRQGIDSISVDPGALVRTRRIVAQVEREVVRPA